MKNCLTPLILLLCLTALNAQEISLMTYNIRLSTESDGDDAWSQRKEFLTSQVLFYAPDVMGVQEALPEQMDYLNHNLTGYKHIGVGREGENQGEFSALFYNAGKLEVLKSDTFWLSETPEKISTGWDAALPRICTYALFKDKTTQEEFYVFNTHFDHVGVEARKEAAALILQKMTELNTENAAVFLTGDLNLEPDSDPIAVLKTKLFDTNELAPRGAFGPSGTFNGFKFDEPVTRRIDYIFQGKSNTSQVLKHAVLSDSKDLHYASDHLPVYVLIKLQS
ncbi:endonuclease/exonuclease/phosphatase family protein [Leeuwenhoekiella sp. MAR_2009_132]|uniref:endonuclease/exonuclease/phosphatase family protein n=1 Tax=Leeuwenhoekiella sp. MAR_2009_132 TaxID=1392489 RepID=UPI0009DD8C45|nr:endonuclease/exonuclease/phosphatase family protein [Leeuwenhoekiella sp. MAR_2009_132]